MATTAVATRRASRSARTGSGRWPSTQAAVTRSNAPSANGRAAASAATRGTVGVSASSIAVDRSVATTQPAPASRTDRVTAPVPAPTSSTRRPAIGSGERASIASASRRYTRSGPRAQASADAE